MDGEPTYEQLIELLNDAHADIYIHQVILGESSVPKRWHTRANELLEKYRPITDRIQALVEEQERERHARPDSSEGPRPTGWEGFPPSPNGRTPETGS